MNNDFPGYLENDRILNAEQVSTMLGISISTLRRLRRAKRFPPGIKLGERRIGWRARDVIAFLDNQIKNGG